MVKRRLKVLQVVGAMNRGGAETWLMHILRNIDQRRFEFHFCVFGDDPGAYAPEIEKNGGRIVTCRLGRNPLSFGRRFRALLRRERYDIVHSHVLHFTGYVLKQASAMRVPVRVAQVHNVQDGKASSARRRLYRVYMRRLVKHHATGGLAVSSCAAASFFGLKWSKDLRWRIAPCAIDLRPFEENVDRERIRLALGIPADHSVVGHVGSFTEQKNHRFLIDIARETCTRRPRTVFLLVGGGPLRNAVERKVQALGLARNVIFAGPRGDVPQLMLGAMDALCMPSLWEGVPLVAMEAQAAGLPCVFSEKVPTEAVTVSTIVSRLPLSAGTPSWASATVMALESRRLPQHACLAAVARSPFNISNSVDSVLMLYEAELDCAGHRGVRRNAIRPQLLS